VHTEVASLPIDKFFSRVWLVRCSGTFGSGIEISDGGYCLHWGDYSIIVTGVSRRESGMSLVGQRILAINVGVLGWDAGENFGCTQLYSGDF
jgi:hypothetical protein